MVTDAAHSHLREILVDQIDRNPDNPRIVFRSGELEALTESIRRHGVQVPISVYQEGRRYFLIDGERRWRSCIKLNKKAIPALVQDKPDDLTNVLLMFNIHALREQWDLLTIALKLPHVIQLLQARLGKEPSERELSEQTGLLRSVIRRCRLLMELPETYRSDLLEELKKPKPQQKLSEDFFIEMERALKTVERSIPDVIKDKNKVRDVLISKYKKDVIPDMTDLRQVGKIARAEKVAADTGKARDVLTKLFRPNSYSPQKAYEESVIDAYEERDLLTRIESLLQRLQNITPAKLDADLRRALERLAAKVAALLDRSRP
jgi:ParB/RepB/Spo0J family partition protein